MPVFVIVDVQVEDGVEESDVVVVGASVADKVSVVVVDQDEDSVGVTVAELVPVWENETVFEGLTEGDSVELGVIVDDSVLLVLGDSEGVIDGVAVGVTVPLLVPLTVPDGDSVPVLVGVCVSEPVCVAVIDAV